MPGARRAAACVAAALLLGSQDALCAVILPEHGEVRGVDITTVDVRPDHGAWRSSAWDMLDREAFDPGDYEVRLRADGGRDGATVQLPSCAGRKRVTLDGTTVASPPGSLLVPIGAGAHDLVIAVRVSSYEGRIACGERPRVGTLTHTRDGLGVAAFDSPHGLEGGGRAVVYVPAGHDLTKEAPVLVGLHPWNGSMWTYTAYAELLGEARKRDVLLLLPSGLGNSLYTADAEDEAMRALDALGNVAAIDPRRVSIWGASMGGAGATTISFHRPDRFASVTSFFGDSKYDRTTYVRSLLPDEAAAHAVNALDVVDNAAHLSVWLIHGERDVTSPIRQSEMLADAMSDRHFSVRFDRAPAMGHSGQLVARYLAEVVARAATTRIPDAPTRVAYRSVRSWDTGAYGVHLRRRREQGDAYVEVALEADGVHVRRADGVRAILLEPGALGTSPERPPPIVLDGASGVIVRWAQRTP
jgi:pimeloyl-ACP methyl ester carboxylesterase